MGINNILHEMRGIFCPCVQTSSRKDTGIDELEHWERGLVKEGVFNRLSANLSCDNLFQIAAFPDKTVKSIARAFVREKPLSGCSFTPQFIDENGKLYPSTLLLTFPNTDGSNATIAFFDEIRNVCLDLKVPFFTDYMDNDAITANLTDVDTFNKCIDALSNRKNPVIGYRNSGKINIPSEEVRLRDVGKFILPTGEKICRYEIAEYTACDGEVFKNAVASKMLLHGLIAKHDSVFPVIREITNIYQIGLGDQNPEYVDSMRFAMTALTAGHINLSDMYEMPSSTQIFKKVLDYGIDGPYLLDDCFCDANLTNTSMGSYSINMDTYDVNYDEYNENCVLENNYAEL